MRKPYRFSMMWISCVCISFYSYAQVEQAWVRRYVTDSDEVPIAVKTTGSAVYVLGQTNQFSASADFILIKYNSAGTFLWSQTYNGTGNHEDRPVAMTLDAAGNIYVVGRSRITIGTAFTGQTVTLKYNSDGALLWSAIKLRPDVLPCEPNDVAVDKSGNVYVTGSTIEGEAFAYDFMTIKYNSSGVEQWTRNYNGTANSLDYRTHIAIDASGNIYVTGESHGILKKGLKIPIKTFGDYYTIKYNPNGGVMWQRRYDSPFHSGDQPSAIALDNSGNVYITGTSYNANQTDYLTMKLSGGDGKILYTARYNGTGNANDAANGIVVNAAGEAYVTGLSDPYGANNAFNYATVKYNSTGAEVWTASYNGPADGTDIANAIRMDGFGFIYVTGESQGDSYDFATVQYGSSGIELWRVRYDGAFLSDKAIDMAVYTNPGPAFEQAHVYVAGESEGVGSGLDIALVKYEQPLVIGEFDRAASGLSNYPNPFTESTTIEYSLTFDSDVAIKIFDPFTSQEVRKITIGERSAGKHHHEFSADGLRPGNYIYKIEAHSTNGKFTETKVMQIANK